MFCANICRCVNVCAVLSKTFHHFNCTDWNTAEEYRSKQQHKIYMKKMEEKKGEIETKNNRLVFLFCFQYEFQHLCSFRFFLFSTISWIWNDEWFAFYHWKKSLKSVFFSSDPIHLYELLRNCETSNQISLHLDIYDLSSNTF